LVDTLVAKTRVWEETHDMSFTYDGVPLLAMLDEYAMLRHEREEEKRRMRVSFTNVIIRMIDFQINQSIF
jgi:protein regulator of cytokinesis 1